MIVIPLRFTSVRGGISCHTLNFCDRTRERFCSWGMKTLNLQALVPCGGMLPVGGHPDGVLRHPSRAKQGRGGRGSLAVPVFDGPGQVSSGSSSASTGAPAGGARPGVPRRRFVVGGVEREIVKITPGSRPGDSTYIVTMRAINPRQSDVRKQTDIRLFFTKL